jgi:dTMP kinase
LRTEAKKQIGKGILIAIEGIDGSGKTIQSKILRDRLENEGYKVELFREPTNGKWGEKIRDLAINGRDGVTAKTEFEYFLFDRKEDVENNILPAIESGKIVIMDRYYLSSVAYQGARGLDQNLIEEENKKIAPIPDFVIIIDACPCVALSRIKRRGSDPNFFESENYLTNVRDNYLNRYSRKDYVQVVDGNQAIEEVSREIWKALKKTLQKYENEVD